MKKHILAICLAAFTFVAFTFTSCDNEDTTAPIITLIGAGTVTVELGDTYTDDGATAEDDEDGDITALIIVDNPVNTDSAGTYTVTYSVSDAAGNPASATRTVIVEIVRDSWVGQYDADHNCPSVPGGFLTSETITAGAAADALVINNFSGTNLNATATVSGQSITIPMQTVGPFVFSNGTGTINNLGNQFNLTYTSDGYGTVETCTAVYDKL
jgi:hypothetical protein